MPALMKNITVFQLTRDLDLTDLELKLATLAYEPCTQQQGSKLGFAPALGFTSTLLGHQVEHQLLLRVRKEVRDVPAGEIRRQASQRIEAQELEYGRQLNKKEREALAEDVYLQLLPRAFSKVSDVLIWINLADNYVVVGETASSKVDESLALLRKALGSLPVVPYCTEQRPEQTMTGWVMDPASLPAGFSLGQEVKMLSALQKGPATHAKADLLDSAVVAAAREEDQQVVALGMTWRGLFAFTLLDTLRLKGLAPIDDALNAVVSGKDAQDHLEMMDNNFVLFTGTARELLADLLAGLQAKAPPKGTGKQLAPAPRFDLQGMEDDPLLPLACTWLQEGGRPSISALQRQFLLGYNRAARLMEDMEQSGMVSAPDDQGNRRLLVGQL